MDHYTRAGLLKRAILLFWTLWTAIVVLLNFGDLFKTIGLLPRDWKLASGNYKAIADTISGYSLPHSLAMILFLGAIAWEIVAAALFWRALRRYGEKHARRWPAVYLAYTALFGLFATFILADELFHGYGIERDHRSIMLLLLATLLAIQLLPDRAQS